MISLIIIFFFQYYSFSFLFISAPQIRTDQPEEVMYINQLKFSKLNLVRKIYEKKNPNRLW